jgi:TRAP-type mannitol/chloroaromatic compound transport system permease small subunit
MKAKTIIKILGLCLFTLLATISMIYLPIIAYFYWTLWEIYHFNGTNPIFHNIGIPLIIAFTMVLALFIFYKIAKGFSHDIEKTEESENLKNSQ